MKKKIFAIILCVVINFSMFTAFAQEAVTGADVSVKFSDNKYVVNVSFDKPSVKGVVLATLLKGDKILAVYTKGAEENVSIEFDANKGGTKIKVFLWETAASITLLDEIGFAAGSYDELDTSIFYGKKLYVDGDSICCGKGYNYGKLIADKYNMEFVTNAAGGATISMGVTNAVKYGTELDWDNKTYYLKLPGFNPIANKDSDGFAMPITKDIYENGFGVYPTTYKVVNGELVEQEYSETMPNSTFFVKFDVPTYDNNTVPKYYRMWAANDWLWEAYRSGFETVHKERGGMIGEARQWLSKSVQDIDENADYVILEGGINDYMMNRQLGELSDGMTGVLDTTTTIGGLEYICRTILEKHSDKKVIYLIVQKSREYTYTPNLNSAGSKTWQEYHDAIIMVLNKYEIPYVDLFETEFDTALPEYLAYTYNNDGVHPSKEGYELFYIPYIEKAMAE